MNTRTKSPMLLRATLALAALCLWAAPALAQTAGGTQIQNRASATYSDGTSSYSVVSNTVTVTVANVSGLAITPDAGSVPNVVAGQSNVDFTFTVTNTGNYATQVRFLASGASVQLSGPATVQKAVIDVNNNGIDAGDTDILANASDVLSSSIAHNATLTAIVRVNVNAGSNTGVFVIVPVPARTTFVSVTPPAGVTVLYSTSPLSSNPVTAATWTTTAPSPLSNTVRVAFNVGASLASGASATNMQFVVSVNTGINATNPIYEIGDAFGKNTVAASLTDQSGDLVVNKGDGNADFNEPRSGVDPLSATQGFQLPTTLTQAGNVLIGPSGAPAAVGPTDNNDDYTNKSVAPAAIAGLSHLDTLGAAASVDFTNTVQNTGNADDTFTLTAPTVPAGFTVAISTNGGTSFTTVSGGGSTTLAVAFGSSANIIVRVTAPAGSAVLQSGGFSTTIRATSGITNTQKNDTRDNLYTGFLKLVKSFVVINATGVGAATDPVPGADIEYTITYSNVSVGGGGAGCVNLVASSIVISEDGASAPNNWSANTTQIIAPTGPNPSDSNGGAITDGNTNGAVTAASTFLKDAAGSLNPGGSATFKFRRRIN